tara:strand:+ start:49 stop:738 length:690 start_codon:yes stop_codon:yes gene_type:complete
MTKVHLLGKAGDKFGKEFNLQVKHAKQLLRAIACQRKGFYDFFIEEQKKGVEYAFKRGEDFMKVGEEDLSFGKQDVFIVPIAQGSVSDGFKRDLGGIMTVIGTILIIIGTVTLNPALVGWGTLLAGIGGYIMFDGIMGLIQDDSPAKKEEAALFGGPVNVVKSGVPIPLCYGRLQVSGAPINFGFTTRRQLTNSGWVNINNPDQEGAGDIGSNLTDDDAHNGNEHEELR